MSGFCLLTTRRSSRELVCDEFLEPKDRKQDDVIG